MAATTHGRSCGAVAALPPVAYCVPPSLPPPRRSYHCNLNILLGKMRAAGGAIKWADVAALKSELEAQVCGACLPGGLRRACDGPTAGTT